MKKVLLLNPPGKRLYIRDYFCSKVSQADYITHPVDLLMLSGILSSEYEVAALDAMAGRLSVEEALSHAAAAEPFAVVSLFGAASLEEDMDFASRLKARLPGIKLLGIGDVFREEGEKYLRAGSPLDALLLDFTAPDILKYLAGGSARPQKLLARGSGAGPSAPEDGPGTEFDIPVPLHELFLPYDYRHPFVRARKFATVLTDYGCPYPCEFCVMSTLKFKTRPVAGVLAELRRLSELGVKEILFHTQTFGAHRKSALELCEAMAAEKMGFGWTCFSRVDVVAPELLGAMKRAGCHTIIFGVESGAEEILKKYRKGYTRAQIIDGVERAAAAGMETVGTFILGLPEETRETMAATLDLLRVVKLDYASFNVAVPRAGTPLREKAVALGLADGSGAMMDQSGGTVAMPSNSLTRMEIGAYRRKAVRIFYLNPGYLLRRLRRLRSVRDLVCQLRQAAGLLRNTFLGGTA